MQCKLPGMSWSQKNPVGCSNFNMSATNHYLTNSYMDLWDWIYDETNEHVATSEVFARSDYVRPVTTDTVSSFPLQPKPPKLYILPISFQVLESRTRFIPAFLLGMVGPTFVTATAPKWNLDAYWICWLLSCFILYPLLKQSIVPAVYLHWNEYFLNKCKQTAWVYYAFYIPN